MWVLTVFVPYDILGADYEFEVPSPGTPGPYYAITRGRLVGVVAGWYAFPIWTCVPTSLIYLQGPGVPPSHWSGRSGLPFSSHHGLPHSCSMKSLFGRQILCLSPHMIQILGCKTQDIYTLPGLVVDSETDCLLPCLLPGYRSH